jgi:hypothetical protein
MVEKSQKITARTENYGELRSFCGEDLLEALSNSLAAMKLAHSALGFPPPSRMR